MLNHHHLTNVELKWFRMGFFPGLNVRATDVKIPLVLQVFHHSVTRDKNAVYRAQCCHNHSENYNLAGG
jgi:hypothetical protein